MIFQTWPGHGPLSHRTESVLLRKAVDEEIIKQSECRTLVGDKALFCVGKIALNSCNAVRELSSHGAWPNEEHWKSMERFVGFLLEHGPVAFLLIARRN